MDLRILKEKIQQSSSVSELTDHMKDHVVSMVTGEDRRIRNYGAEWNDLSILIVKKIVILHPDWSEAQVYNELAIIFDRLKQESWKSAKSDAKPS